jgi:hypothetical protein
MCTPGLWPHFTPELGYWIYSNLYAFEHRGCCAAHTSRLPSLAHRDSSLPFYNPDGIVPTGKITPGYKNASGTDCPLFLIRFIPSTILDFQAAILLAAVKADKRLGSDRLGG